jgi:hypothetical protein
MYGLTQCKGWILSSKILGVPHLFRMSLLLVGLLLTGCSNLPSNNLAPATLAQASTGAQNATVSLDPASGFAGIYVYVSGTSWPQNMMVLVSLEDEQGRSDTLAASDTDQTGNLSTGFLYPIDQRWITSDSAWVVTTTADGKIETRTKFTIVRPGEETASASPLATATSGDDMVGDDSVGDGSTASTSSTDGASSGSIGGSTPVTTTSTVTNSAEAKDTEQKHVLTLPLISAVEPASASNADAKQIKIKVEPDSINCRNGNAWFTITILSGPGFDAPSVVPDSLSIFGETGSEAGVQNSPLFGTNQPVSFRASDQNRPNSYRYRWHLEDADGDGSIDMVMEFQVGFTDLTCDATVVVVTGKTQNGGTFEGSKAIKMKGRNQG